MKKATTKRSTIAKANFKGKINLFNNTQSDFSDKGAH